MVAHGVGCETDVDLSETNVLRILTSREAQGEVPQTTDRNLVIVQVGPTGHVTRVLGIEKVMRQSFLVAKKVVDPFEPRPRT